MHDFIEASPHLSPVAAEEIHDAIEVVPDFPKKGILFRNVMSLLAEGALMECLVQAMIDPYFKMWGAADTKIVGIESRGFIFGAAMATKLGMGFIPARKAERAPDGTWVCKLPGLLNFASYDLEYGSAALAMRRGSFQKGDKVIIVDDLLATGGTASAAAELVRAQGAEVISHDFVIELRALGGRKRLVPQAVVNSPTAGFHALLTY